MNINLRADEDDLYSKPAKGKIKTPKYSEYHKSITGKRIVFTGKAPKKRPDIIREAVRFGVLVDSGVTKNTDILVCSDRRIDSENRKYKAAVKYGIPIISYDAYNNLLEKELPF